MKTAKTIKSLALLSIVLMMASCASTEITKSWVDPSVSSGSLKPFTKVLVIASLKDQTSRRFAEDKIAAAFKAGIGVPSYTYLTDADTVESAVQARIRKDGFDGVLTIRLTNVSQSLNVQNNYGAGYYGGWYGYGYRGYGYGYGGSTTVSVDNTYFVETCIYSTIPEFKMLWSGITSTLNPSKLDKTLDEIIEAVRADLISKGVIKTQPK